MLHLARSKETILLKQLMHNGMRGDGRHEQAVAARASRGFREKSGCDALTPVIRMDRDERYERLAEEEMMQVHHPGDAAMVLRHHEITAVQGFFDAREPPWI